MDSNKNYSLLKLDPGSYSIIDLNNRSVLLIEDVDEYYKTINTMLSGNNLVIDIDTYKKIEDGRPIPVVLEWKCDSIKYIWPDTEQSFVIEFDKCIIREIKYNIAIQWLQSSTLLSKEIKALQTLWPVLKTLKTSDFISKAKSSDSWIFATCVDESEAKNIYDKASELGINVTLIPVKVVVN